MLEVLPASLVQLGEGEQLRPDWLNRDWAPMVLESRVPTWEPYDPRIRLGVIPHMLAEARRLLGRYVLDHVVLCRRQRER